MTTACQDHLSCDLHTKFTLDLGLSIFDEKGDDVHSYLDGKASCALINLLHRTNNIEINVGKQVFMLSFSNVTYLSEDKVFGTNNLSLQVLSNNQLHCSEILTVSQLLSDIINAMNISVYSSQNQKYYIYTKWTHP